MAYGEAAHALRLLERMNMTGFLRGRVVDLGCGPEPVLLDAVGVNCDAMPGVSLPGGGPGAGVVRANVDAASGELLRVLGFESVDTVFSSHALEHLPSPILWNLAHWLRFVRPQGSMVLYLPDEKYYRFAADPKVRNPEHLHYLTMDTFEWYALQVQGAELLHLIPDVDVRHGRYSFLAIFRKR